MNDINIQKSFIELGIKSNDIVMIHGDAGVAAQYINIPVEKRIDYFIDQIKEYFSPHGTILVPSFTYSSTKNEDYDLHLSPSQVGLFSEHFRISEEVYRTNHPIFSVSVWGKFYEEFLAGIVNDCFGNKTFFDILFKSNAKIITMGCSLNTITFVHYVEQINKVSYRYFKKFNGKIINNGNSLKVNTRYFVRNLKIKTNCNLNKFAQIAKQERKLKTASIGRFPAYAIGTFDFFNLATNLLKKHEYSLIDEGYLSNEI